MIPTRHLNALAAQAEDAFGKGTTATLVPNSTAFRGDVDLAARFRRDISFPDAVAAKLRNLPEARHLA